MQHLRQIDVLHVYVGILEILVEALQFIVEGEMVERQLEKVVGKILEKECAHVLLGIGWDLELLIVQTF